MLMSEVSRNHPTEGPKKFSLQSLILASVLSVMAGVQLERLSPTPAPAPVAPAISQTALQVQKDCQKEVAGLAMN
jgi:hypothetical protein